MKNLTLIFAFMFFAIFTLKAAQITVSNDPQTPAQYSDLQTAIDAASPGDTLLIASSLLNSSGSPISYGTANLYTNLVLIGGGAYFENGATTSTVKKKTLITSINLYQNSANTGASNSKIIGIEASTIYFYGGFNGSTLETGGIKGVLIEKCNVGTISFTSQSNYHVTNEFDTIRNCIISSNIHFNNWNYYTNYKHKHKNISIENNIFDGSRIYGTYTIANQGYPLDSVYVRNNLFLNRTTAAFATTPFMVIENNIFYKSEPSVLTTPSGVTFNNNLSYINTATLPGTGNLGSGNLNNSNPAFVNYIAQGGAFECGYDFSITSGSPAEDAGTDGSDIGLTGGISPFYHYCNGPQVPTIKSITLPTNASSVPQGGTLNVTFKAKNKD